MDKQESIEEKCKRANEAYFWYCDIETKEVHVWYSLNDAQPADWWIQDQEDRARWRHVFK